MNVIEIEKIPLDCVFCSKIEAGDVKVKQKIALYFEQKTLERRKLHQFGNIGVTGTVKSIQIGDDQKVYSIRFENDLLSEFIVSGIKEICLVCDKC